MVPIFGNALRSALVVLALSVVGAVLVAIVVLLSDERDARIAGEVEEQRVIDATKRIWGAAPRKPAEPQPEPQPSQNQP